MYQKSLHRFSQLVASATLLLIAAGGLVTSTGSGLSVPDWPLSYGQFFPPMIGGIRFEHSHRLIAAGVGLLTLVLAIWIFLRESRIWLRGFGLLALLAVVAQAILGALTVKYLLPAPVSIAHACLGQTFFALAALIALFTSREWHESSSQKARGIRPIRRLLVTTLVFVYLQLILGAVVRHTGGTGVYFHAFVAFLILAHVLFVVFRVAASRESFVREKLLTQAALLATLAAVQVFLGFGSYVFKLVLEKAPMPRFWEVILTTAHQTTGAAILALTLVLTVRSFRLFTPDAEKSVFENYADLVKLRLVLAALATTLLGFVLASRDWAPARFWILAHALIGTFLVGAGANALNQFLERDTDALMHRTENRPLPSGRLRPRNALGFGVALAAAGLTELFLFVNPPTGLLGGVTLFSYVFFYTPLKRKTYSNTFIGAIPGALPSVMGWAAARGEIGAEAGILFSILFLWQLPHFFAIAWLHRADYERSGLRMLPVPDENGQDTARKIAVYCAMLIPTTLLPVVAGMAGRLYLAAAVTSGVLFFGFSLFLWRRRLEPVKKFVAASIYYLLFLIFFMMADKIL